MLPESRHAAPARYDRRASAPREISRHAAAARQPQRARAHEARLERRRVSETARAHAHSTIPGVSIRTSFIVGFPGETENDFRELCDFVRAAEFDWMGVFAYSDEDTSKSFALENKVDAKRSPAAATPLMAIQKKISARKLRKRVGQRLQVMLEGPSKDTDLIWEARLEGMAPEIDGKVYITEFEGVNDADRVARTRHARHSRNHRIKRLRLDRPRRRIRRAASRPMSAEIATSTPSPNPFPILASR